ncbi:MAG: oxidoreductase, partial [Bacteroidota bacterium]
IGPRPEWRPGEKISQLVMPLISFLLPVVYRPIIAKTVAEAMVHEAISDKRGVIRYAYCGMKK